LPVNKRWQESSLHWHATDFNFLLQFKSSANGRIGSISQISTIFDFHLPKTKFLIFGLSKISSVSIQFQGKFLYTKI
jgi:hypothetical protein